MMIIRKLLRTDGSSRELSECKSLSVLRELIHADSTEAVPLQNLGRPLHVMLVDRMAYHKHLPMNVQATKFYLDHCAVGAKHKIRGDAVIVPAYDIEPEPEVTTP